MSRSRTGLKNRARCCWLRIGSWKLNFFRKSPVRHAPPTTSDGSCPPFAGRFGGEFFQPDGGLTGGLLPSSEIRRQRVNVREKLLGRERVGRESAQGQTWQTRLPAEPGELANTLSHNRGGIDGSLTRDDKLRAAHP